MSEGIIIAIIGLVGTILSVVITSRSTVNKIQQQLQTSQAVTDTKIEHLTEEVREHNNFAKRVPVLEEKVNDLSRRVAHIEDTSATRLQ